MDPLTALSVAGTVVQFVDFGSKLLSGTVHLYKSARGSFETTEELELVTADLQSVVVKLRKEPSIVLGDASQPLTEDLQREKDMFLEICNRAANIAEELLEKLKSLTVEQGGLRVFKSFKAAIKVAWSKDEVASLRERLLTLKDSLQSRLMVSIQEKLDIGIAETSKRFDSLDNENQQILSALTRMGEEASISIIDTVARLLSRLEAANSDEHHKTRMLIASLRASSFPGSSMNVITAKIEMLSVEPDEEKLLRLKVNRRLLNDLSYPGMTSRYEDISQAHPQTFDWIFSDTRKWQLPWSDFSEWLREDGEIYWIRGKAGSGKSTLMKYIYDDQRTKKLLQKWAKNKNPSFVPCCIATFFFWNSGTDLQQSQRGLLRALLYQVLEKHPLLIPIVFPGPWAEIYSEFLDDCESVGPNLKSWPIKQLQEAFERLVRQKEYRLKICFIVDGLDEFSGDAEQLCILFQRLSTVSECVKFCLSSRSWVIFQEALENCPGLRLQDLTTTDIDTYINGKFKESSAFLKLAARDETLASLLTREISNRAEGVFLWVRIVVHQLIRGLTNRDGVPQLWKRLQSFPRELNPLYDSILSQIEPIYLDWATRAFQIMNASTELSSDPFKKQSKESWQVDASRKYPGHEKEGVQPLTLTEFAVAFMEDNDLTKADELPLMYEDLRVQLTARCAGLLEVSDTKQERCENHQDCYEHVRWMHRTARDFINEDAKWMKVLHDNSPADFSPYFTLMRSSILALSMHLRPYTNLSANPERDWGWAANAWIYAYHANGHDSTRRQTTVLLKRLSEMQCRGPYHDLFPVDDWELMLRATKFCLSDFVEDTLSIESKMRRGKQAGDLLTTLCDYLYSPSKDFPTPTVQMVESLLNMGVFVARHVDTDLDDFRPGAKQTTLDVHPSEIPSTIESYLGIIEVLLNVDVDPTKTLSFVPRDFIFRKKVLQEKAKEALQKVSNDATRIIHVVEDVIWEEVKAQQRSQKCCSKKRKLYKVRSDGAVNISDDSDDSDDESVVFLSDEPAVSGKRVKVKDD